MESPWGTNRNLSSVFVDIEKPKEYHVCFYIRPVNDTSSLKMASAEGAAAVKKLQQVLCVFDEPRWYKIAC